MLADEISAGGESEEFQVQRCWRFNSWLTPARLWRAIRRADPDVVWFNMGFSTFARQPIPALFSIAAPALSRISGFYTHVTLHTVFERINSRDAGVRMPGVYRAAGRLATKVLLRANDITVLLPSFRSELLKKYKVKSDRIHFRPHGIFSPKRSLALSNRTSTEPTVLAFGYWETYFPAFTRFSMREMEGFPFANCRTTSDVPSVKPSFTTMTSVSQPLVLAKELMCCRVRGSRFSSFRAGITMLKLNFRVSRKSELSVRPCNKQTSSYAASYTAVADGITGLGEDDATSTGGSAISESLAGTSMTRLALFRCCTIARMIVSKLTPTGTMPHI